MFSARNVDDLRAGDCSLIPSRIPWELPDKYPAYSATSSELAVVLPVFSRYKKNKYNVRDHPSLRYALWSRWSLLQNTNAIEAGIPILFCIEDIVYEANRDRFETLGVRDEDCVIFSPRPDTPEEVELYHHYRANLSLFLTPIIHEAFQKYERIMLQDADLYFCRTDTKKVHDILHECRQVPPEKIGIKGHSLVGTDVRENWKDKVSDEVFYSLVEKVFGRDWMLGFQESRKWANSGVWQLYSPAHHGIGTPFGDFVEKLIYVFRCDECIMGLWSHEHSDDYLLIRDVPYFGGDDDILQAIRKKIPYYYFHFRPEWNVEKCFRHAIGDVPIDGKRLGKPTQAPWETTSV